MAGTPSNALNIDSNGVVFLDASEFIPILPGASGTVLTSTGTGTAPSFQAPSGGSGITTIDGDTGSATGSTVTIESDVASNNSGATVMFVNSGAISKLDVTDSGTFNTFIGKNSGDASITGTNNTSLGYGSLFQLSTTSANNTAIGEASLQQTTGSNNTAIGGGSLAQAISGNFNLAAGQSAGANYATSESSNICLNSNGVVSESNALHIGNATGTGNQELNKAYICGINGVTSSNPLMVTINSATNQLGVAAIPSGGSGITSVNVQTFTAPGTYTPTTGMVYCIVECLGGGAEGGTSASGSFAAGGGGSGGYAKGFFDAAAIGASQVVTIGIGGQTGIPAGQSTFGALLSGGGGSIGTSASTSVCLGGSGGGCAGGFVQNVGQSGLAGITFGGTDTCSGEGGSSMYGSGGAPTRDNSVGSNGEGFGSGGSGGSGSTGGGGTTGGTGTSGIIIVTEYIA